MVTVISGRGKVFELIRTSVKEPYGIQALEDTFRQYSDRQRSSDHIWSKIVLQIEESVGARTGRAKV